MLRLLNELRSASSARPLELVSPCLLPFSAHQARYTSLAVSPTSSDHPCQLALWRACRHVRCPLLLARPVMPLVLFHQRAPISVIRLTFGTCVAVFVCLFLLAKPVMFLVLFRSLWDCSVNTARAGASRSTFGISVAVFVCLFFLAKPVMLLVLFRNLWDCSVEKPRAGASRSPVLG